VTSLSPELRERILSAAKKAPAPTRQQTTRTTAIVLIAGFGSALALFLSIGGYVGGNRPASYMAMSIAGWLAMALIASWGAFGRGGSMLGRPASWLGTIAVCTTPLLGAWIMLGALGWPGTASQSCPPEVDAGCLKFTIILSLAPFAAFLFARRNSDPVHPRVTGAALGAASGAWGALCMNAHCSCAAPLHQFIGHAVPITLLAVVGFLVGGLVLRVREVAPTSVTPDGATPEK